jgi:hypothetical protein
MQCRDWLCNVGIYGVDADYLSFAAILAARPCSLPALFVGSLSRVLRVLQLSLS